jgi:adenylate cyclase
MAEKRVRRRLAAILAADVVAYSRVVETDEEGTIARLNDLRALAWFSMKGCGSSPNV